MAHHIAPWQLERHLPAVVGHILKDDTRANQNPDRQGHHRPKEGLEAEVPPDGEGVERQCSDDEAMSEMCDNSRPRRIQEPLIALPQYLRVHGVELLEGEAAEVGVEVEGPAVFNMLVVGVMMVVRLELLVAMGHFNKGALVLREGVGAVVRVAVVRLVVGVSLVVFSLSHRI